MKNPNCTNRELKRLAAAFTLEDWNWLTTQMTFLDATATKTAQEIRDLADILLTEQPNQTL